MRNALRRLRGGNAAFLPEPALETVYRDLFLRELGRLGEPDGFYPVGGAANHSLLYLILRLGLDYRPRAVLDIGAGQSSILWSMLARRGFVGSVLTLENDSDWAGEIARNVDHRIVVTPLVERLVAGRRYMTYDWPVVAAQGPFDVIVCDGPRGVPRCSRAGVLAIVDGTLPADFALLLDDCERPGEQDTVDLIHRRLGALGIDYSAGVTRAAKSQMLFAAGRYRRATFL